METHDCTVAVIGGGVSGLSTAWRLRRLLPDGHRVVVIEKATRPGGTAWTEHREGYSLELGPNGFLDNKPSTVALCSELGLSDALVQADPVSARRFIFLGDRLRQLPTSPKQFLKSDLLSWKGKLRVLSERWRKPLVVADESIYDFGCRRIGKEATENLLDAFVTGVLAGDPKLLSLPACFPRMAEMEREFGSLFRAQTQLARQRRKEKKASTTQVGGPGGALTAPAGGMKTLIDALTTQLAPDVHLGRATHSVERTANGRWLVHTDGATCSADAVVLACPAFAQGDILSELDGELAQEVGAIPYTCAVVASVGFHRADLPANPEGFGYLTPQRLGRPVLGVLWSSCIFPRQAPDNRFQFRAIMGGWRRRDVLEWDDGKIVQTVLDDLRETLKIQAAPEFTWVYRWEKAIPQYHLGHLERLRRIEDARRRHPGLWLTGNPYRGVSLNDCTHEAEFVSEQVKSYLFKERG